MKKALQPVIILLLSFSFIVSASLGAAAQAGYSGTITYTPPGGQDSCIYTIDVNISITRPHGKAGIAIECSPRVTGVKGIIFQGKTYSSSQVPGVFQEYLASVHSDFINLKYTVVVGLSSQV